VSVNGDDSYGWAYAEGWEQETVTGSLWGHWWYYVYTWAEAHVFLNSSNYDPCYSSACADASAGCSNEGGDSLSASAGVSDADYQGDLHLEDADNGGAPDGISASGMRQFWNYGEGVWGDHTAVVCAGVYPGGDDEAFAHVCARGMCSLSQ
jgi:hypothetical protein